MIKMKPVEIAFKTLKAWESAIRGEAGSFLGLRVGVYKVSIERYTLKLNHCRQGKLTFKLLCEGWCSEEKSLNSLLSSEGEILETLNQFTRWGEEIEWSIDLESSERPVIFTGDLPT